jgi:glutamate-ammonia-ligase adenylyltransferase
MIESYLSTVPEQFQPELTAAWEDFSTQASEEDLQLFREVEVLESLVKVWASSRFIVDACKREPTLLGDLIRSDDLYSTTGNADYLQRLQATAPQSEVELHRVLRIFRRREMVRIAWRDIAGWSELSETLMDVSLLAETCVQFALGFAYTEACERNGPPLGKDGEPMQMVVLGMGKLGAWELNYSSDIDLIFAMPEEGYFNNRKQSSYSEFFSKVGRKLIQALDNMTVDGFVFRVDMRLRPWGDSGALVLTFDGMEKYYREHGREWERYAMVKARAIAGDMQKADILQARLRPFVYRSYLDYGVFAELRELKQQIVDQQKRRKKMDNIKLGPGGIRDIEFITQVFQLIRGGRDKALQDRRLQHILRKLADDELLPTKSVEDLLSAYRFLRVVEHRLQQYEDKQTNDLPSAESDLERLAFSMDFSNWDAMAKRLAGTRKVVKEIFEQVFSSPQLQELPPQAESVWTAEVDQADAVLQDLTELGYPDSEEAGAVIASFKRSPVLERLGEKGGKAISQLMPLAISAAVDTLEPAQTLQRVTQFFGRVAQRSMYLSLLLEHPLAFTELLQLAARSPWIVEHISQEPLLLDELLNPNKLYEPLIKSELASELRQKLSTVDINDIESQILELRHFQQVYVLRVAAADITGSILLITVSDYLSDIAEVILEAATRLAWQAISSKSGLPQKDMAELSGLGVIALGGLGSRDLSYDSDLHIELIWRGEDAVEASLAQPPGGAANFYKMVASRLNLLLSSRMVSGIIYRLYTPGDSERGHALLISDMPGYQHRKLTDLERARYVQARYLFGDSHLAGDFTAYRQQLLSSGCSLEQIAVELQQLREDWSGTSLFSLDYGIGALGDIRSIVTSGVLCHSSEYPELVQDVETMSLLHALVATGFIAMDDYRVLQRAYMKYREKLHVLDLQHVDHMVPGEDVAELSSGVEQVYSRLMN